MKLNRSHIKIQQIASYWHGTSPFMFEYLACSSYVNTEEVNTIGVALKDGKACFCYNEEFIDKLSVEEVHFIMIHEILHIIKLDILESDNKIKNLWNIATDVANNEEIIENWTIGSLSVKPPENCLFIRNVFDMNDERDVKAVEDFKNFRIADTLYYRLCEKDNLCEDLCSIDDHSLMSECDKESLRRWSELVKERAKKKSYGSMSRNAIQHVEKLFKPKKPSLRFVLRKNIVSIMRSSSTGTKANTWRRVNRRGYEQLQGKMRIGHKLIVGLDVSGSCFSLKTLKTFMTEIDYISRTSEVILYEFDTEVVNKVFYKRGYYKSVDIIGGGGTDVQPLFDRIYNDYGNKYSAVIFSDGCFNWNINDYDIRTLWILNENITDYIEKSNYKVLKISEGVDEF